MRTITRSAFAELVRKRAPAPADAALRKMATGTAEPLGGRKLRFTCSTEAVDREGDVVAQAGWELGPFRRNPVILAFHNADAPPIARATDIAVNGKRLLATFEFVPADMPVVGPMAEAVLRLYRLGFMSAVSVGFRPLEWAASKDPARGAGDYAPGLDFTRQELVEVSCVTVPALADALLEPGQRVGAVPVMDQRGAAVERTKDRHWDDLHKLFPHVLPVKRPTTVAERRAALAKVRGYYAP